MRGAAPWVVELLFENLGTEVHNCTSIETPCVVLLDGLLLGSLWGLLEWIVNEDK
jgi:hypothetical protein